MTHGDRSHLIGQASDIKVAQGAPAILASYVGAYEVKIPDAGWSCVSPRDQHIQEDKGICSSTGSPFTSLSNLAIQKS